MSYSAGCVADQQSDARYLNNLSKNIDISGTQSCVPLKPANDGQFFFVHKKSKLTPPKPKKHLMLSGRGNRLDFP